ncbi:MAG: TetR/AcrR family transcriptional regulator [Pseudomonadales bacterium]
MTDKPPAPWAKPRRRQKEFGAKRQAILETAARLFNENGYETTSLSQLAKALNITKPTLYHYFESKDQILMEIQGSGQAQIEAALHATNEQGGKGLDKLEAFISRYTQENCSPFGRLVIKVGRGGLAPESQAKIDEKARYADSLLRDIITEGIADGSIAPVDVKMATFLVFGACNWVAYWYQNGGTLSAEQVAEEFIRILRHGFEPADATDHKVAS